MKDGGRIFLKPILLPVVFLMVIISITVMTFWLFGLSGEFSDLISDLGWGGVYEVSRAAGNLPVSGVAQETIDFRKMPLLREMLTAGRFGELNNTLDGYQRSFEADPVNEYKLSDAYQSFSVTDRAYEVQFKQWIDHSPGAYQPYLALAVYYYAEGLESRGTARAGETSRTRFDDMHRYFLKALRNIDQALALHPGLPVAYLLLIGIYNNEGDNASENRTIETAMKLFPSSMLIMFSALWSNLPRWGGSYEQMAALARKAEAHINANPCLSALYGLIYHDQARIYRNRKNYQKALALLDKALLFGDLWIIYDERARLYCFELKDYAQALENVNRSIELRPTKAGSYRLRSIIYFEKACYYDSKADLERAELIRPGANDIVEWRKKASDILMGRGHKRFKADPRDAIEKYNLALDFNRENADAHYWRGRAYYNLNDDASALADFQSAIAIDPRHFASYQMIGFILARNRQWERIIDLWNQYIALEPDNPGAYIERAGARYRNRDRQRALQDLKTACALGSEIACKRYAGWSEER